MSIPPEGQSLLRDALPESDAEPGSFIVRQVSRSPSHAILHDSDDEVLLDGLEASPTLVLGGGRARQEKVVQPRETVSRTPPLPLPAGNAR
ncbi:hypothetical protein AURDEDRAFT_161487 [Auricularia subglabra TFB-10046 SS5]|nr:hypothetical protein AURDEDRAFT_161487 [Auricularia subglabra TFB-10046 SS5]